MVQARVRLGQCMHVVHLPFKRFPVLSCRHQMAAFAKDYDVVALDMRGYNTSDKPQVCVGEVAEGSSRVASGQCGFGLLMARQPGLLTCSRHAYASVLGCVCLAAVPVGMALRRC